MIENTKKKTTRESTRESTRKTTRKVLPPHVKPTKAKAKIIKAAVKKVKEERDIGIKWQVNDDMVSQADVTVSGSFKYTQHHWCGDCVTDENEEACYELLRDELIDCLKDCGDDIEKLKEYLTIENVTLNYYHGDN